jgi:aldehyde:ferredoxin oxidoreductase
MLVGERRINMMRYFNSKAGFTKEDDKLPARLFEAFKDGPSQGISLDKKDFEKAKEQYYKFAGWDNKIGSPTEETLIGLSLGWLIENDKL